MYLSIEQFSHALRADGVLGALKYLNRGVAHRYTSISRLDGLDFVNAAMADKAGQELPATFSYTPVHASFCQFVLRDGQLLADNTSLDEQLNGLPYQGVVMAYHGVALSNARGERIGTLNHFDHVERQLSEAQLGLMKQAALRLSVFAAPETLRHVV